MITKNVSRFPLLAITFILLISLSSCRHDAELPPIIANVGDSIMFDSQVLPIIVSNCSMAGCHDGSGEKFPLLNYEQVSRRVKAGNPNKSSLYQVITTKGLAGNPMPPSPYPSLTNAQITVIQLWIMEGAKNTSSVNYCDSIHVNYSGTIRSILDNNCVSCHNTALASGNLSLLTYDEVKNATDPSSATFMNLLDHIEGNGYSQMPQNGSLSTCNIAQIKKWINDGFPKN
ncbi:MAG: hypothetical protein HXX13_06160 [Bacteroidetes bacterium]|nr:hypothetical protein [Bacteroidota bacterium]